MKSAGKSEAFLKARDLDLCAEIPDTLSEGSDLLWSALKKPQFISDISQISVIGLGIWLNQTILSVLLFQFCLQQFDMTIIYESPESVFFSIFRSLSGGNL